MCADQEFARKVLSIPVAQVIRGMSFEVAEQSALDTLTDVMQKFIEEVGYRAQESAHIAGRNESNFHDIMFGLDKLGIVLDDVIAFYHKIDIRFELGNIEFPQQPVMFPGIICDSTRPLPEHIPSFLPPFPDNHTYMKTPIYDYRETNPKKIRELKAQQRVQSENYLASLHQHTSGNQDVINYDQINDPKTMQIGEGIFKPAKDPMELISEEEQELKVNVPATTLLSTSDKVQKLLHPTGLVPDHPHIKTEQEATSTQQPTTTATYPTNTKPNMTVKLGMISGKKP